MKPEPIITDFDERWLQPGGIVPVDIPTIGTVIREVQRLREWQAKANDRIAAAEKRANDAWAAAQMERESAEWWHKVADERAAEIVRLMGGSSSATSHASQPKE